jgi:hypothetical protein
MISSRPADKVKDEVSVIIGYTFKPSADAAMEIGAARFIMSTRSGSAWIRSVSDEFRAVHAMLTGSEVVIKGTSQDGAQTSDTYLLKGFTQALDRVAQECR